MDNPEKKDVNSTTTKIQQILSSKLTWGFILLLGIFIYNFYVLTVDLSEFNFIFQLQLSHRSQLVFNITKSLLGEGVSLSLELNVERFNFGNIWWVLFLLNMLFIALPVAIVMVSHQSLENRVVEELKRHKISVVLFFALLELFLAVDLEPRVGVFRFVEDLVLFLHDNLDFLLDEFLGGILRGMTVDIFRLLIVPHPVISVPIIGLIIYLVGYRNIETTFGSMIALAVTAAMGYWAEALSTLVLLTLGLIMVLLVAFPVSLAISRTIYLHPLYKKVFVVMAGVNPFLYIIVGLFLLSIGYANFFFGMVLFLLPFVTYYLSSALTASPEGREGLEPTKTRLFSPQSVKRLRHIIHLSLLYVYLSSHNIATQPGYEIWRGVSTLDITLLVELTTVVVLVGLVFQFLLSAWEKTVNQTTDVEEEQSTQL